MMNTRRVFMSQPRAPEPQFMNFIRTRFCSPQISFPPTLQQNYQYPRQFQSNTQRIDEYGHNGMSGGDGRHMQQMNGIFWDKFRDIRKRSQEFNESEDRAKNMKSVDNNETDPADDYQFRPKLKKTHYGRISAHRGDGHLFSICSYNILAQKLLEMHPYLYEHCIPEYLNWEYRKINLLRELKNSQADIMCLQEVQEDHFIQIFKPEFTKLGFSCVFKKRTGSKQDGCAIFYRDRSFQLETCRSVEYFHPGVYILDRDNIGLIVILKSKHVPSRLCVANTHLLFNPRRGDVKLAQLSKLFAEIDEVAYETTETGSGHCPIILCGDFNSQPKSPLLSFIENASLDYSDMLSREVCEPPCNEESSWKNRGSRLHAPLLPRSVKISESCQYVHVIEQRRGLRRKRTEGKEKSEIEASKTKTETKPEKQLNSPVSTKIHKQTAGTFTVVVCDEGSKDKRSGEKTDGTTLLQEARQVKAGQPAASDTSSSTVGADSVPSGTASSTVSADSVSSGTSSSTIGADGQSVASCSSSCTVVPNSGPSKPSDHPPTGRLHHNLNIESAYLMHDGFVTTNHTRTNCVVDFMFNSRPRKDTRVGDLKRMSWLPMFTEEEAIKMGGLPNKHWSSDHYRLQVQFMLRSPNITKVEKK